MIGQLLGGGYYYQPGARMGRAARVPRAPRAQRVVRTRIPETPDYNQLLREYLLKQYLEELVATEEQDDAEEEGTVPRVSHPGYGLLSEETEKAETQPESQESQTRTIGTDKNAHDSKEPATPSAEEKPLQVEQTAAETTDETSDDAPAETTPQSASQALPAKQTVSQALNLYQFDHHYIVLLALPGTDKSQLNVDYHMATNELVISGASIDPYLSGDAATDVSVAKITEFKFGAFKRHVKLPGAALEAPTITAKYCNGLLEVKIARAPQVPATVHKITVEDVPDEEFAL